MTPDQVTAQIYVGGLMAHLNWLHGTRDMAAVSAGAIGGVTMVDFTKAKLAVYYAVLQGDKIKCQAAVEDVKTMAHSLLEGVMNDSDRGVAILHANGINDHYTNDAGKTGENARQMGGSLKRSIDMMESMLGRM